MQCGSFDIVTFDKIVSPTGCVTVGSMRHGGGNIQILTPVPLPYSATPVPLTGEQLLNTYMTVGDLTNGATEYDIPTADTIVAAFAAAGSPLSTGDWFSIYILRGTATPGALRNLFTIGLVSGDTPCTYATTNTTTPNVVRMTPNSCRCLLFEVTDITVPAIRIFTA